MKLTLAGNVVFSCGCWIQKEGESKGLPNVTANTKKLLDKVHFEKIKRSDGILVLNKNGYIGESTKNEIEFAKSLGLTVRYLENLKGAEDNE